MVIQNLTPTQIGDITEAKLKTRFIEMGYAVLEPMNNGLRYDFVIEKNGRFQRVQAKTARLVDNDYIIFNAYSVDASTKTEMRYLGEIDLFAAYCPQNDKYYVVDINATPMSKCILRVTPTKNNQTKGIRWAADYEF